MMVMVNITVNETGKGSIWLIMMAIIMIMKITNVILIITETWADNDGNYWVVIMTPSGGSN